VTDVFTIRAGTDYADAIGMLLRFLGPGGPFYRYAKERSGYNTLVDLDYPTDSDWLVEAKALAAVIGMQLIQSKTGIWMVVDLEELNEEEERALAFELAFQMGELFPDKMLASLSRVQWDEWKEWLQKRRLT
jgi:hypothetical protein